MSMDDQGNEYVYPPEKWLKSGGIICAAEEQWATHKELDAAIADTSTVMDELEARIEKLEARLAPPEMTISQWPQLHTTCVYPTAAAHPPEADYAHIPAAEWEALCAEVEQLRAKWNAIPWEAIRIALSCSLIEEYFCSPGDDKYVEIANAWFAAFAPKEAEK